MFWCLLNPKEAGPFGKGRKHFFRSNLLTAEEKGVTQVLLNPKPIMEPNERHTAVTLPHFPKESNHKLTLQVFECEKMLVRSSSQLMWSVLMTMEVTVSRTASSSYAIASISGRISSPSIPALWSVSLTPALRIRIENRFTSSSN